MWCALDSRIQASGANVQDNHGQVEGELEISLHIEKVKIFSEDIDE